MVTHMAGRRSPLLRQRSVLGLVLASAALAGCGGGSGSAPEALALKSAKVSGSHVVISYSVPTDGGQLPKMLLSVLEPESGGAPYTETVEPAGAEGEVTLPFKFGSGRELIAFGSILTRSGRWVYFPQTLYLHSPAGAPPEKFPPGSPAALANCRREEKTRESPEVRCGRG